jgi:GTP diphosphokinase / guanosine-3',5'-bis(diphosphate) 3'-diphosphatase
VASTVDRVLPWRRSSPPPAEEVAPLLRAYRARHGRSARTELITRAYLASSAAHEGQIRKTGEAYIHHPIAVAKIVAELGLDDVTVAAALLHDAVEDTDLSVSDVEAEFGPEVAAIVDGVTKLDRIHFDTKEQQQAATVRKMIVAMSKDLRVLIIKLADRLHNMRTIAGMPHFKQERTARETLDIYAPLAHRLGMQEVRQQLEDLSFAALHPKRFAEIDHMVATRTPERDLYLHQVIHQVEERLAELRLTAEVTGRPKHMWSIYEKMVVKGREFDDIFDLVAIRVIVDSVKDCYAALGSIHATWKPVPGRFKDYIAMPKFNLYQSLHTTVVGPQGKPLEVQIRTREMHARAERGVAAHWQYKSDAKPHERSHDDDLAWLSRIVDWQEESTDPDEFMKNLKVDLEQDEVFVFTPKGRVITLPKGATPIDFAYTVHTEVGHTCIGAKVNGRLAPLHTELTSGDTVDIVTSKVEGAGPSRDWLQVVVSPRARNKIRQWFSRERREDAIETGREDLVKALRRENVPIRTDAVTKALEDIATSANYADLDSLYAAIGEHHQSAKSVAGRVVKALQDTDEVEAEQLATNLVHDRKHRSRSRRSRTGVHVEGLDDVMVRLSRCCTPVPGDEIVGFITRGRGVSVHRADCANAVSLGAGQGDRLIDVEWDGDPSGVYVAAIEVKALDRARLLRDVTSALSDHHVNILASSTATGGDRVTTMRFEFELGDPGHLDAAISSIRRIDSVYDAYRVVPGKGA